MKIAVISDIHGNAFELEKILNQIHEEKVDKIFCLGDIVGYGPEPGKALSLVHEYADVIVPGNHDVVAREIMNEEFSFARVQMKKVPKQILKWTLEQLSDKERKILKEISEKEYLHKFEKISFSHSSPHKPENFNYVIDTESANKFFFRSAESSKFNMAVVGHLHNPQAYVKSNPDNPVKEIKLSFKKTTNPKTNENILESNNYYDPKKRYLLVSPSVGLPRNQGKIYSGYIILDTSKKRFCFKEMPFSNRNFLDSLIRSNMPEELKREMINYFRS